MPRRSLTDDLDRRRELEANIIPARVFGASGRGSLLVVPRGSSIPVEAASPRTYAPGSQVMVGRQSTDPGQDWVVVSGPPPASRGASGFAADSPAPRIRPPTDPVELVALALGPGTDAAVSVYSRTGSWVRDIWSPVLATVGSNPGQNTSISPDGGAFILSNFATGAHRIYSPDTPGGESWTSGDLDATGGPALLTPAVWHVDSWYWVSWLQFTNDATPPLWRFWRCPLATLFPVELGDLTRARDFTTESVTRYQQSLATGGNMTLLGPGVVLTPGWVWAEGIPPGADTSIPDIVWTLPGSGSFTGSTVEPDGTGQGVAGASLGYGVGSSGLVSADTAPSSRTYADHWPAGWWVPTFPGFPGLWTASVGGGQVLLYETSGSLIAAPETGPYSGPSAPVDITLEAHPEHGSEPVSARAGTDW